MKTHQHRLPIPQYEFPFVAVTFNLFSETTADGARVAREQAEAEQSRAECDAAQNSLFASPTRPLRLAWPYRLRADDLISYEGKPCPVVRVTDCAAVVAVEQPAREFTTLFGKRVRIQPKPRLVRISSNSTVPILKRAACPSY